MNRYVYIAMLVVLAGAVSLGCPAGQAASGQGTGVHHAASPGEGGGTAQTIVPAGRDRHAYQPEVTLTEPLVSRREAVWFKDEVLFSARVEPVGISGTIAVLIGEGDDAVCVSNLNDIGWPPDEVAQDGIWAGKLDWPRVPAPGRDQPLSFAYQRDGKIYSPTAAGTIDLLEEAVEFVSFTCTPSGEVQLTDDLEFAVELSRGELPGSVHVLFDTGQETELAQATVAVSSTRGRKPYMECVNVAGVFNGKMAVPFDVPLDKPVKLRAQYLDSAGEVVTSSDAVSITVLSPEIYLVGLDCEPSGPVEIGEYIRLKAELNKSDQRQEVSVYVEGPDGENGSRVAVFDGTEYQRGGRQLTGVWEGDFEWPWQLSEAGVEYRVYARISSGNHVISEVEGPSITLLAPEVEIIDVKLTDWPEVDIGQHIRMTARTNKPVRAGGLRIIVNGERHGGLADDGVSYGGYNTIGYNDVTAYDANWIGNFAWYINPNQLAAGVDLPARMEYAVGDHVYATYELEPVTINGNGVTIESLQIKPEGPIHLGDPVNFTVILAKPISEGAVVVCLEDGTRISTYDTDSSGSRIVTKLNWKDITEPGDYGPIIVNLGYHKDVVSTFKGERLVVLPPE